MRCMYTYAFRFCLWKKEKKEEKRKRSLRKCFSPARRVTRDFVLGCMGRPGAARAEMAPPAPPPPRKGNWNMDARMQNLHIHFRKHDLIRLFMVVLRAFVTQDQPPCRIKSEYVTTCRCGAGTRSKFRRAVRLHLDKSSGRRDCVRLGPSESLPEMSRDHALR